MFDQQIDRLLPEIEHNLRKKRSLLIDAKSAKNIRNKQVSFKVYDETNSIIEYNDPDIPFDMSNQNIISSDINEDLAGERAKFLNRPDT